MIFISNKDFSKEIESFLNKLHQIKAPVVENPKLIKEECIYKGAERYVYKGEYEISEDKYILVATKWILINNDFIFILPDLESEIQSLLKLNEGNECFTKLLAVYYDSKEKYIGLIFEFIVGWTLDEIINPNMYKNELNNDKENKNLNLSKDYSTKDNDNSTSSSNKLEIPKLSNIDKIKILMELCDIIDILRNNKIIHRDLKPQNIMIRESDRKIILLDFGESKICNNTLTYTSEAKGTNRYLAPESYEYDMINENVSENSCNTINSNCSKILLDKKPLAISDKYDIWSLGCIIFQLITGTLPWYNVDNDNGVIYNLINKKNFPIPSKISKNKHIYDIIFNCTNINPNLRPSHLEVKDKLNSLLDDYYKYKNKNSVNNTKNNL